MTIDQNSTLEDPAELTTTSAPAVEIANQTTGSSVTSSSSSGGVRFYVLCAVLAIGVVGTAANGLVLYALVASKQQRKHVLIFNQNLLDFVSSFFLSSTHAAKLCNIQLGGTLGYWLCLMVVSEGATWGPFVGSTIDLDAIVALYDPYRSLSSSQIGLVYSVQSCVEGHTATSVRIGGQTTRYFELGVFQFQTGHATASSSS